MEILLNNGSGDSGANAATASVADGQDVDGVLHDEKTMGKDIYIGFNQQLNEGQ